MRRFVLFVLLVFVSFGCAQYSSKTNKSAGYSKKMDRVFVWSSIGQVEPARNKHWIQSDSFENYFHSALRSGLSENGLEVDVRDFVPGADKSSDFVRFERNMSPSTRMLVSPVKHRSITSQYNSKPMLTYLSIDVTLIDLAINKKIWRAQFVIDSPAGGISPWGEDGAKKIVDQIIDALKKDGLVGSKQG